MALLILILSPVGQTSTGDPNTRFPNDAEGHKSLELSKTVDREISFGQAHYYQIRAGSRQFLSLEIECWGSDLIGIISPSNSSDPIRFTFISGERATASAISNANGDYGFSLQLSGETRAASRYQIRLREVRPAAAADEDRLLLERTLADAGQLRRKPKKEAYNQAIGKYQEALWRARALSDRETEVTALKNLGKTFQALNQNTEALANYDQARVISKHTGVARLEADIANCLAHYYFSVGSNRQAKSAASSGLRLSRQAGSQSLEGHALFVLGEAHYGLGDLAAALEYYQKALRIRRTLNDYQGQIEVLVSVGYTFSALSDTARARDAHDEAQSLSVQTHNSFWEVRSLRARGIFHTRLGEYQLALDSFLKALRIFDSIEDPLTQATVLAGIGFTYENLGEESKALQYDNEAINIFREIKNPWGEAELQMDTGRVHFNLGQYAQALERYERALALFRSLGITRMEAQTLRDMGRVFEASGDTNQALDLYRRSLALSRGGQDHRSVAYTFNYLGRAYERAGDRLKALGYYERALGLSRRAADPAGEAFTLFQIARVRRDLGDLPEALALIKSSVELSESLRSRVASRDVRASFVASTHQYYELHADILMQLHRKHPSEHFAEAALEATEKARARSLLESLQEAHLDLSQGVDPVLLDRERSLAKALEAKLARRAELTRNRDEEAQALTKEIDLLTAEFDSIRSQIKLNSPRYTAFTEREPLSLSEITQRVLDENTVLLEYLLGEERSYVWVVTRTEFSSYQLPPRAQIEAAARRFRDFLTVNQTRDGETFQQHQLRIKEADAQIPAAAAALSDLLIAPVRHKLTAKRLMIVPDGALHYVPFQALTVTSTTAESERVPLVFDYEIVYEPSASALAVVLNDRGRRPAEKSIAVFANPVFSADDPRVSARQTSSSQNQPALGETMTRVFRDQGLSDGRIPALPASREEAEAIMSFAPWGTGLKALGFEANRALATKPELAQYRIVHFATHGFVDYERPELSGLVLSLVDSNGQPQDGYLRLHDIYNLKLSADLVVLSACNTGLGKEIKGEGLIGLTRGFMYAGASGVAASLWKVDDEATAELMKYFYEGMFRRGLTPSAAMREAQLSLWRQTRWQAPYYWAAFIIQGRYDQTERAASSSSRAQALVSSAGLLSACILIACLTFGRRRTQAL